MAYLTQASFWDREPEADHKTPSQNSFAHGQYQVDRYCEESWTGDVRTLQFIACDYPRWELLEEPTGRRLRNQLHLKQPLILPPVSATFPLPVSAIAALRTTTVSSIDSE